MSWPPDLTALKLDMRITDERDDAPLQLVLDAAVAWVAERRRSSFNFDGDLGSALPDPTASIELGTLRLAARWHARRRSPDALIEVAEFGASRIPAFDIDIERLLGIGRYRKSVVA
ncbi:MAG: phage gp6-like head-tail connector protein [Pseudonocardia sp.]|nr:phage gp6-like head-tail connector protein [Pseudonocardia sp.]